ncbi:putative transposase [Streptantibioticus cattleyicolor NRRL 8057 = DSM 46488]|uniref:Putative transposase n=1 Tax=Streptantibioticus cattleyicolor (strain ATCC 35852 / DSM 46488 / JCM 4925 / NBRC 14057 / NRRL 8057) TaxID=1003195 RepID=G8X1G5_STREN|nr:putative transposase [Streptantibioticus cattleyicolor NRRL 8057 = DSM 46488]
MGIILDELLGQTPVQGKGKGKGKGKEALNEPGSPCNTPLTIRWETQIMSASHSRMADHWWWRPGWRQGRRLYTWPPDASRRSAGRVAKTLRLLAVVDPVDDTYRRQMNRQLTVQESRHRLARDVCHGKCGTIHQVYRGRGRTSSARSAWS